MRRSVVGAEDVRRAARMGRGASLVLVKGLSVLTEEARDLAARLKVTLEWKATDQVLAPTQSLASDTAKEGTRVHVALGSDHGAYELRRRLLPALQKAGYSVRDLGCPGPESTDFPVWARAVAECVASGEASRGIMLDTVGVASAMVCNRVAGIRAAACESLASALSSRRHNDANVLTLGARLGEDLSLDLILAWLKEPYEGGRHQRRVELIHQLDR